jgi:hypothetical protein
MVAFDDESYSLSAIDAPLSAICRSSLLTSLLQCLPLRTMVLPALLAWNPNSLTRRCRSSMVGSRAS